MDKCSVTQYAIGYYYCMEVDIPPFRMTTQNRFSAFTWALKPVLKSI